MFVEVRERAHDNQNDGTSLVVFPNPAAGSVNIAIIGNTAATTYSVVDAAGRVVHAGTFMHGNVATIEGLPTGVYAVWAGSEAVHGRTAVRQASFVVVR